MARGEGGARARTWDVARPRGAAWPSGSVETFGRAREIIARWLVTDVAAGRLMPWLPICFGFGVVVYFTADREPSLWAASALSAVFAVACFLARNRPVAFPLLLALTTVAAGFATVTWKSVRIAHPILQHTAWNIAISGFIEVKARLNPPLRPLRPGGYDFSRDLYFQRIGATGFVQDAIKRFEPPVSPGFWIR